MTDPAPRDRAEIAQRVDRIAQRDYDEDDPDGGCLRDATAELRRLRDAATDVLLLHRTGVHPVDGLDLCVICGVEPPCPTVATLDADAERDALLDRLDATEKRPDPSKWVSVEDANRVLAEEREAHRQTFARLAAVEVERDKHIQDPDDPAECDECGHPWWSSHGGCVVRQSLDAALAAVPGVAENSEQRQGRAAMRLAYADPPYLGCCKLYGHEHNAGGTMPWDGRCWDDLATHVDLLRYLDAEFDGWAYSLTSTSLRRIIEATDDVSYRIGSWQKPFAAFKRNVRIAYTWEPVFWSPARDSSKDGAPVGRDHISEPITLRRGFTGAKPAKVNRWVLDLMGYVDGDDVTDLFPGTAGMAATLREAVLL